MVHHLQLARKQGLDPTTARHILNSANNLNKKENGSFPSTTRNKLLPVNTFTQAQRELCEASNVQNSETLTVLYKQLNWGQCVTAAEN